MTPSLERFGLRVMSGEARGVGATLLRGALTVPEPFYAAAMLVRNRWYDAGVFRTHRLPRRVVSVGNLTAGGTGKTPVVRWLAEQLAARGWRPAVLLRGYRQRGASFSDEQALLQAYLDGVAVVASPDRVAGAAAALQRQPHTDVILLDDGFQHRRVARDFDLVLINAGEPFGYGHVHPRGLLREPLRGLRRASAVLLTHADAADAERLRWIEGVVWSINQAAPVFHTVHEMTGLRGAASTVDAPAEETIDWLRGRAFFSFSGIGSPRRFHEQLIAAGGRPVGTRAFPDHHEYGEADVDALTRDAAAAGAEVLLTTEKDWVKLSRLASAMRGSSPPIKRVEVRIRFGRAEDEATLLDTIVGRISPRL